jgi:hypothetical protein
VEGSPTTGSRYSSRPLLARSGAGAGTTVSLGQKTLAELQATGRRTEYTIPAGRMGNEQPINVTSEQWAAVLYERLDAAAKRACASLDARDLASQMRFKDCVQTGIGSAVAKIDRPVLTAYYKARTNGRDATIQIAKNQN